MKIKKIRYLEWGLSFWLGIGLMSAIEIIKITYTKQVLNYNWWMLGFSAVFVIICVILLAMRKKK